MKVVLFFEKPGCVANEKQKKILKAAGCLVLTRNLLVHPFCKEELFAYLEGRPVCEWFNPNAPALKQGSIQIDKIDTDEALRMLLENPILIRRPLLNIGGHRMCGFEPSLIEKMLH